MSALSRRTFLGTTALTAAGLVRRPNAFLPTSFNASPITTAPRGILKKGSSGGIYVHPWDITEEGIDSCFNYLGDTCGLTELFLAAIYHANTFLLPHNPKRM